jgi:hypothetical protein
LDGLWFFGVSTSVSQLIQRRLKFRYWYFFSSSLVSISSNGCSAISAKSPKSVASSVALLHVFLCPLFSLSCVTMKFLRYFFGLNFNRRDFAFECFDVL